MALEVTDVCPDVCPLVWTMENSFLEFSNLEGHVKNGLSKIMIWKSL